MPLGVEQVRGILPRGGTILGTSRTNPIKVDGGVERIEENLAEHGVDALIAIGGEDTLGVAKQLYDEGVQVVGVPKTIDNDLAATDYTFGFDTAVNIAMEAIDRLHTTAESHHRALVVEVMGRHAGWIALHAGMAGGANVILIPEQPFDIDHGLRLGRAAGSRPTTRRSSWSPRARRPRRARWRPRPATWTPSGTSGSAASASSLADEVEKRTGKESRAVVLGHMQRGGTPTAFDRVLATRFGLARDRRGPGRCVRADGRAAGHRHRPGPAGRGDRGAEDRPGRAVRRGGGVLRLSPAG